MLGGSSIGPKKAWPAVDRLDDGGTTAPPPPAASTRDVAAIALALLECARPHQWAKNALVFMPAVLAGVINSSQALVATSVCFAALCLVASGTYIFNDLLDAADDRKHWSKRHRPIARGALPFSVAVLAAPIAVLSGLMIGLAVSPLAAACLFAYLVLTLVYSAGLKRVPVLDVAALATLFTLRLVLGIVGAGVQGSPWLLTFSMFLFGSLCLAKRYVEVEGAATRGQSKLASRGYQVEDAPVLIALGLATGTASVVIMVLYIIFDAFHRSFYGNTVWLWAFPVILFLWISRLWVLAVRRELDDDPVAFALTDPPSIALGATMLVAFILAWSGTFA
jgi:4-hydroxybenzoate polyprenyltransferase